MLVKLYTLNLTKFFDDKSLRVRITAIRNAFRRHGLGLEYLRAELPFYGSHCPDSAIGRFAPERSSPVSIPLLGVSLAVEAF